MQLWKLGFESWKGKMTLFNCLFTLPLFHSLGFSSCYVPKCCILIVSSKKKTSYSQSSLNALGSPSIWLCFFLQMKLAIEQAHLAREYWSVWMWVWGFSLLFETEAKRRRPSVCNYTQDKMSSSWDAGKQSQCIRAVNMLNVCHSIYCSQPVFLAEWPVHWEILLFWRL